MATETREILFKFTASEIEIQKSLEKVSQSLVDARTELKQLNQGFNLASKTISNYDNDLGQLNKQLAANEITQEEYNDSLEELNNDLKTAQKTTADYANSQLKLKNEISKLSKEQRGYLKDLNNLEKVTDKAEGSNEQLRASVSLLTKEYNKLSKEERETTARGQLLTKTLREQTDALKENEKAVGDNRRNVGNYQDAFSGLTGGLTDTIGSLVGPGGLVAGITIAADLIGDGIAAVQEITAEFVNFRGEVQRLTDVSGPELDSLTAKIVNISRVFEEDFNEVLLASNSLSKQLGISAIEAATLIEKGFLSGANASGELLDILKEYGPQLNAVGIGADQAISLISQQVKEGVFSDKGIDAIKEASEKIALFEDPAKEALAALGIDNIEGLEIFEVIQLASEAISKLPEGSKEATAAIDGIFGTPGLDAGFKYISVLQNAESSVDNLIDTTNPLINLQVQQLEVGERLAEAQNELSKAFEGSNGELSLLIDEGKIFLIEVLLGLIERLKPVFSAFGTFIDFLGKIVDAFSFAGDKINEFLKGIGLITEDIQFFKSATEIAVDAIINVFTGGFGAVIEIISFAFDSLSRFIDFASTIPDRLSNIFNTFKEFSNDLLGTDFDIEPQIKIDTSEAESQIDGFQVKLDDLEVPVPVSIDFNEQKARAEKAKLEDAFAQEEIKANEKRKREAEKLNRELKLLNQTRLKDEIAGIELRLLEVSKGSLEELNIKKALLDKQTQLTLLSGQNTANQELLITKQTEEKKKLLTDQFTNDKLEISISGLEKYKSELDDLLNIEISTGIESIANAKLTTEVISITKTEAQKKIAKESKETLDEITLNEKLAATQSQDFSNETLRVQIKDLKKLLEDERLTAEERREIEAQLQAAKLQEAANVLNGISQLTGAFTGFFAAQKEKQLEAAQGNAAKEAEINEKFAEKQRKLAIFESIINTGAAVVQALPNIPLSILVGTIGAIQTASIAQQSFAVGGFTGNSGSPDPDLPGRSIVGYVHDNEYVIPSNVLSTPKGMGLALEADKMRGFASGGFTSGVAPTFSDGGFALNQANESNTTAELGKLFKEAVSSLPTPVVNVNEITDTQNRVKTKENTSGF